MLCQCSGQKLCQPHGHTMRAQPLAQNPQLSVCSLHVCLRFLLQQSLNHEPQTTNTHSHTHTKHRHTHTHTNEHTNINEAPTRESQKHAPDDICNSRAPQRSCCPHKPRHAGASVHVSVPCAATARRHGGPSRRHHGALSRNRLPAFFTDGRGCASKLELARWNRME